MKLELIATALAANLVAIPASIALDANLPAYQAVSGIAGQVKSVGSDTLNNEMELWAKGFEALYPGVKIEIEGKVSAGPAFAQTAAGHDRALPSIPVGDRPPCNRHGAYGRRREISTRIAARGSLGICAMVLCLFSRHRLAPTGACASSGRDRHRPRRHG